MGKIVLQDFLREAYQRHVSDIYMIPGSPLTITIAGQTSNVGERLFVEDTAEIVHLMYRIASRENSERVFETGDDNFSFSLPGVCRFRVSMLRQRNSYGCIVRMTPFDIPSPGSVNIPDELLDLCDIEEGLVLVTGMSGSGKTTTIACMLDRINHTRKGHLIVTLENPLEYVHRHAGCLVTQREIYTDTASYLDALQAVRYQRAQVLMISDLPDPAVASEALHNAQAGSLVLTTFQGTSSANALQNFLDMYSEERKATLCAQLATTLKAIVFQRLLPTVDRKLIPAFEIVRVEEALQQLIAEGNIAQISASIAASKTSTVIPFDRSLIKLFRSQSITFDTATKYAMNKDAIRRHLI